MITQYASFPPQGGHEESFSPCAVTVGFFDGVHLGHQHLIRQVCDAAHDHGVEATVATFARHPRQVLQSSYQPLLLSTLDEKIKLLELTGIDRLVVLPFDKSMALLTAEQFMDRVLRQQLNAQLLVTGYDNRFGHNREEGFSDYVSYGQRLGIDVVAATPYTLNGVNVSSTVVRVFLQAGDVEMAGRCLGHLYSLSGRVVHGRQVGRQMGFPTANIQLSDAQKLVPRKGVYGVRCCVGGTYYDGMMNIGTRPTFTGAGISLEVHLFGFNGSLYDQQLSAELVFRHREERKFFSAKELANQLRLDAAAIQENMRKREKQK